MNKWGFHLQGARFQRIFALYDKAPTWKLLSHFAVGTAQEAQRMIRDKKRKMKKTELAVI